MAVKTYYTLNTANANWGQLQDGGSAPAAAASAYGWGVAKLAAGYWRGRVGATATGGERAASTWLTATTVPVQGTGTTNATASHCFRSPTALSGVFANTTWGFSFGVRTGAASHAGRMRIQIWRGANADGSGAVKVGGIGIGGIATLAATATTYTTSGTVAAPGVTTLLNEYLFFEVEWQGTTAGTSNSCSTLFYQGVCTFTTPDFAPSIVGTLADTEDPDAVSMTGAVTDPPITGTMDVADVADDASMTGDNGEVLPGTWVEVWTSELGGLNPDWAGYTIVGVIPVSEFSQTGGSKIRITFIPPWTYGGSEYSAVWIGNGGGADPYDFGDTPVRVTVGGSTTVTIIASGEAPREGGVATPRTGEVVTDEISFVKDATNSFVIAAQLENAALDAATYNPPAAGRGWYWKGVVEAGLANKSGYTDQSATGSSPAIWKIELFIGAEAEVTGTLDGDEPADTADLTGAVAWPEITGTFDADEIADDFTASGLVGLLGPFAAGEAADDATVSGTLHWIAVLAAAEGIDAVSLTGDVSWQPATGTLGVAEGADDATATGGIFGTGTVGAPEGADDATLTGIVVSAGPFATQEAADGILITGGIVGSGALAVGEAADAAAMTGAVLSGLGGTLASIETADAFSSTGQVTGVVGTLAATGQLDTALSTGTVEWRAVLAAGETPDDATLSGWLAVMAGLAAGEAPDTGNLTGAVRWLAVLSAGEAADQASFSSPGPTGGPLWAAEGPDVASLSGTARWIATLSAGEAADAASLTGGLAVMATLAAAEAADAAAVTGLAGALGAVEVQEQPDAAAFDGSFVSFAEMAAVETGDSVFFTAAPPSIQEAEGHYLKSEQSRVRELASGDHRVRSLKYPVPRPRTLLNNYGQRVRELNARRVRTLEGV